MININKLLDLRFVIGMFFTIIGLLLLVHSFTASADAAESVNRWAGAVFVVFGVVMILLSFQKEAHDEILEEPPRD